jgi:D-amino-acid dehydrogenase
MRAIIVGAGIVGVTIAHALLDAGYAVDLVDGDGIAAGASRGNAGWIAHTDIMPLASPKVWRNLPRWLADPLGPLTIRPAYLPRLLPWLARFIAAGRPAAVERGISALSALNGLALPAWERRLEALGLVHYLRRQGILSVWSDAGAFRIFGALACRQRELGIAVDVLDVVAVRDLEPVLGPCVVGGALYPAGCHVSDPAEFTLALGSAALARGARLVRCRGSAIEPGDGVATLVLADGSRLAADRVVVAAGAWSRPFAACLGEAIPLDTERGYNVTLPRGSLGLSRPVKFEDEGFVTSPLETGDRVGGAVEFGGLIAPPNFARVDAMLVKLRRFLPSLGTAKGPRWMGFRPSMPDSLPVISISGRSERVLYAFGHGHYGLTQAAATAEVVAALVCGRPAPIDAAPYCAGRF